MESPVIIPLRPDRAPSAMRIVAWLVALNFIMAIVSVVMLGVLTTFLGTAWMEDPVKVAGALGGSIALIALLFGLLYFVVRRRSSIAAKLELSDEVRLTDKDGVVLAHASREDLPWRPVQLYDNDGSETWPVGPAIELRFPDRTVVTAFRNSTVRWGRDVASVMRTDWLCDEEPFHQMLTALEVEDELVPY